MKYEVTENFKMNRTRIFQNRNNENNICIPDMNLVYLPDLQTYY